MTKERLTPSIWRERRPFLRTKSLLLLLFSGKKKWESSTFDFFLILQEAIVKIMKMRKKISNAQLQTELVEILKNMFLPSKKMIKEQIEWLIEHKYMKRDDDNINMFIYMA